MYVGSISSTETQGVGGNSSNVTQTSDIKAMTTNESPDGRKYFVLHMQFKNRLAINE